MDVTEFMGNSEFLKASDLNGKKAMVKIKAIHTKEFTEEGGATKSKLVLEFEGRDKMVVMNVTNTRACADAFGIESNMWRGKQVTLSVRQTQMGPGIAVTPILAEEDLDDDIPF